MIHLTRLRNGDMIVNADIIETVEATPDTVITLLTGKKMMVQESPEEVLERVIEYRHKVGANLIRPIDPKFYAPAPHNDNDE
ncbi:MAG: flagellar FlbD family protein [Capsulimonadaceae bacterium]|nr:flagellar FlbD family protein [Capsulimonadaceae bacterium]